MVHQLLPMFAYDFSSAIVLGDSASRETTQFDMVQAFSRACEPTRTTLRPDDRIDIVPADYVGKAIVAIHQKGSAAHNTYHLSAGTGSQTYRELTDALAKDGGWRKPMYVFVARFSVFRNRELAFAKEKQPRTRRLIAEMFWPYLVWNTVFDNREWWQNWAEKCRRSSRRTHILCCGSAARIVSGIRRGRGPLRAPRPGASGSLGA